MGYRRDRIEIARDILHVCKRPRKITDIIRLANVQYNSLQKYLQPLIEGFLIVEEKQRKSREKNVYTTTDKGREILHEINDLANRLKMPLHKQEVYS